MNQNACMAAMAPSFGASPLQSPSKPSPQKHSSTAKRRPLTNRSPNLKPNKPSPNKHQSPVAAYSPLKHSPLKRHSPTKRASPGLIAAAVFACKSSSTACSTLKQFERTFLSPEKQSRRPKGSAGPKVQCCVLAVDCRLLSAAADGTPTVAAPTETPSGRPKPSRKSRGAHEEGAWCCGLLGVQGWLQLEQSLAEVRHLLLAERMARQHCKGRCDREIKMIENSVCAASADLRRLIGRRVQIILESSINKRITTESSKKNRSIIQQKVFQLQVHVASPAASQLMSGRRS